MTISNGIIVFKKKLKQKKVETATLRVREYIMSCGSGEAGSKTISIKSVYDDCAAIIISCHAVPAKPGARRYPSNPYMMIAQQSIYLKYAEL